MLLTGNGGARLQPEQSPPEGKILLLQYGSVADGMGVFRVIFGAKRVVEQPGAPGAGLHADTSMVSHGEGFPFWNPKDDPGSFDLPFAVVAHEMAHPWILPYALVEGAPFLSEGLAWCSVMQVVRASRGGDAPRPTR
jgi:hypothetical protein